MQNLGVLRVLRVLKVLRVLTVLRVPGGAQGAGAPLVEEHLAMDVHGGAESRVA